ncbi:unnamed protein product [Caenorhabditis bovis]|uniref:Uncharacterized protein n=1 Tax=Caenorhabditis bovis TaxID=2654633 RepID=A0A8S1F8R4_9PELO|nr:unnamed protein product [Caenorhabditis bovis]
MNLLQEKRKAIEFAAQLKRLEKMRDDINWDVPLTPRSSIQISVPSKNEKAKNPRNGMKRKSVDPIAPTTKPQALHGSNQSFSCGSNQSSSRQSTVPSCMTLPQPNSSSEYSRRTAVPSWAGGPPSHTSSTEFSRRAIAHSCAGLARAKPASTVFSGLPIPSSANKPKSPFTEVSLFGVPLYVQPVFRN